MGQVCISEQDQKRLVDLQAALDNQVDQTILLKQQLERETERYNEQQKEMEGITSEKIEQLSNEKKQLFKTMLKEKKKVSKLEDQIEDYKKEVKSIQDAMNTFEFEREEKARKEKEEQERKAKEEEEKRKRKEADDEYGQLESQMSMRSQKKKAFQMAGLGHIGAALEGIKTVDYGGLAVRGLETAFVSAPTKALDLGIKGVTGGVKGIGKGLEFGVKGVTGGVKGIGKGFDKLVGRDAIRDPTPFKVKDMDSSDEDSKHSEDDYEEDPEDAQYQVLETKETLILDQEYDAESEATHVHSWLQGIDSKNRQDMKQLKHRLASLLTTRSEGYREELVIVYYQQYGQRLDRKIKKIIQKGNALNLILGLLMTRAQYDAVLISECVANWDIEPVADIICCRSLAMIRELREAYKKKLKTDIGKQLQALAQKEKKRTLVKVIQRIFSMKRKEKVEVDIDRVNRDSNFILTTKTFKNEKKEKLVLIFCANSVQYVKVLNDQFKLKSKDSLTTFIDKKLGPKSTVGRFCKIRIEYALDTPDYYAKMIKRLGVQFKKNQKKISDIFIQRMEIDLDLIQRKWNMKKYGDGKSLKEWVVARCGNGSSSGIFLSKMLDNCSR
eukprot:206431_1